MPLNIHQSMQLLVETNLSKSNDVKAGSGNTERRRGSNSNQKYKSHMLEKAKEVKYDDDSYTPEL